MDEQLVSQSNVIETNTFAIDGATATELKENFVEEFVADIETSSYESGEIPTNSSEENSNNSASPLQMETPTVSARSPDDELNSSSLSPSSEKSSDSPRTEVPPLTGMLSACS